MKISVQAISEVCEGEICRRSVRHDYGIGNDMGINVEVRSKSWVVDANGFWLPVQVDSWLWVADLVGFGCVLWVQVFCVFWV